MRGARTGTHWRVWTGGEERRLRALGVDERASMAWLVIHHLGRRIRLDGDAQCDAWNPNERQGIATEAA